MSVNNYYRTLARLELSKNNLALTEKNISTLATKLENKETFEYNIADEKGFKKATFKEDVGREELVCNEIISNDPLDLSQSILMAITNIEGGLNLDSSVKYFRIRYSTANTKNETIVRVGDTMEDGTVRVVNIRGEFTEDINRQSNSGFSILLKARYNGTSLPLEYDENSAVLTVTGGASTASTIFPFKIISITAVRTYTEKSGKAFIDEENSVIYWASRKANSLRKPAGKAFYKRVLGNLEVKRGENGNLFYRESPFKYSGRELTSSELSVLMGNSNFDFPSRVVFNPETDLCDLECDVQRNGTWEKIVRDLPKGIQNTKSYCVANILYDTVSGRDSDIRYGIFWGLVQWIDSGETFPEGFSENIIMFDGKLVDNGTSNYSLLIKEKYLLEENGDIEHVYKIKETDDGSKVITLSASHNIMDWSETNILIPKKEIGIESREILYHGEQDSVAEYVSMDPSLYDSVLETSILVMNNYMLARGMNIFGFSNFNGPLGEQDPEWEAFMITTSVQPFFSAIGLENNEALMSVFDVSTVTDMDNNVYFFETISELEEYRTQIKDDYYSYMTDSYYSQIENCYSESDALNIINNLKNNMKRKSEL